MINIIYSPFIPYYEALDLIDWNTEEFLLAPINYGHLDINDFDGFITNKFVTIGYITNRKEIDGHITNIKEITLEI